MSYRLPTLSTTSCTEADCSSQAVYDDQRAGDRSTALSSWEIGAGHATCPDHHRRLDVLHFAG